MIFHKQKKGQVESQFNWIFVLVAGGVILLFFSMFIFRYKSVNDQKLQIKFYQDLDLQLSLSEVSTTTLNNISNVPNKNLKFSCKGLGTIGFNKKIVFAPSTIKATKLGIYTYSFLAPFKVNNFVYVLSPNTKYVFITDRSDETYLDILTTLGVARESMSRQSFATYSLSNGNSPGNLNAIANEEKKEKLSEYQSIRFVFINQNPSMDLINDDMDEYYKNSFVSVLHIDSANQNNPQKLTFYDYDEKFDKMGSVGQSSYYFDQASLLGAVIVDNKNMYDCMVANAFNRLYYVADTHIQRIDKLSENNNLRPECKDFYVEPNGLKSGMTSLKEEIAGPLKDINEFKSIDSPSASVDYVKKFNEYVELINTKNDLIRYHIGDCPVIY